MTANEWLGVMKQAQDFPKGMEKLIVKYGEMLITEHESKVKKLTIPDVSNRFSASEMAEWFHNNYEEIAKAEGWQTQDKCKVEFKDLPEKNKSTMIKVCERWLNGC